eukprot:jgi/Mesvir1/25629/Mv01849-RA.2
MPCSHAAAAVADAIGGKNATVLPWWLSLPLGLAVMLLQPCLILQCFLPLGQPFSMELSVSDTAGTRRKMFFSSAFADAKSTPLHCQIPLHPVLHGQWLNLAVDMAGLFESCFRGQSFHSLDLLALGPVCRIRKIFTLKSMPSALGRAGDMSPGADASAGFDDIIPRVHDFPAGVESCLQCLDAEKVMGGGKGSVEIFGLMSPPAQRMTSPAGLGFLTNGDADASLMAGGRGMTPMYPRGPMSAGNGVNTTLMHGGDQTYEGGHGQQARPYTTAARMGGPPGGEGTGVAMNAPHTAFGSRMRGSSPPSSGGLSGLGVAGGGVNAGGGNMAGVTGGSTAGSSGGGMAGSPAADGALLSRRRGKHLSVVMPRSTTITGGISRQDLVLDLPGERGSGADAAATTAAGSSNSAGSQENGISSDYNDGAMRGGGGGGGSHLNNALDRSKSGRSRVQPRGTPLGAGGEGTAAERDIASAGGMGALSPVGRSRAMTPSSRPKRMTPSLSPLTAGLNPNTNRGEPFPVLEGVGVGLGGAAFDIDPHFTVPSPMGRLQEKGVFAALGAGGGGAQSSDDEVVSQPVGGPGGLRASVKGPVAAGSFSRLRYTEDVEGGDDDGGGKPTANTRGGADESTNRPAPRTADRKSGRASLLAQEESKQGANRVLSPGRLRVRRLSSEERPPIQAQLAGAPINEEVEFPRAGSGGHAGGEGGLPYPKRGGLTISTPRGAAADADPSGRDAVGDLAAAATASIGALQGGGSGEAGPQWLSKRERSGVLDMVRDRRKYGGSVSAPASTESPRFHFASNPRARMVPTLGAMNEGAVLGGGGISPGPGGPSVGGVVPGSAPSQHYPLREGGFWTGATGGLRGPGELRHSITEEGSQEGSLGAGGRSVPEGSAFTSSSLLSTATIDHFPRPPIRHGRRARHNGEDIEDASEMGDSDASLGAGIFSPTTPGRGGDTSPGYMSPEPARAGSSPLKGRPLVAGVVDRAPVAYTFAVRPSAGMATDQASAPINGGAGFLGDAAEYYTAGDSSDDDKKLDSRLPGASATAAGGRTWMYKAKGAVAPSSGGISSSKTPLTKKTAAPAGSVGATASSIPQPQSLARGGGTSLPRPGGQEAIPNASASALPSRASGAGSAATALPLSTSPSASSSSLTSAPGGGSRPSDGAVTPGGTGRPPPSSSIPINPHGRKPSPARDRHSPARERPASLIPGGVTSGGGPPAAAAAGAPLVGSVGAGTSSGGSAGTSPSYGGVGAAFIMAGLDEAEKLSKDKLSQLQQEKLKRLRQAIPPKVEAIPRRPKSGASPESKGAPVGDAPGASSGGIVPSSAGPGAVVPSTVPSSFGTAGAMMTTSPPNNSSAVSPTLSSSTSVTPAASSSPASVLTSPAVTSSDARLSSATSASPSSMPQPYAASAISGSVRGDAGGALAGAAVMAVSIAVTPVAANPQPPAVESQLSLLKQRQASPLRRNRIPIEAATGSASAAPGAGAFHPASAAAGVAATGAAAPAVAAATPGAPAEASMAKHSENAPPHAAPATKHVAVEASKHVAAETGKHEAAEAGGKIADVGGKVPIDPSKGRHAGHAPSGDASDGRRVDLTVRAGTDASPTGNIMTARGHPQSEVDHGRAASATTSAHNATAAAAASSSSTLSSGASAAPGDHHAQGSLADHPHRHQGGPTDPHHQEHHHQEHHHQEHHQHDHHQHDHHQHDHHQDHQRHHAAAAGDLHNVGVEDRHHHQRSGSADQGPEQGGGLMDLAEVPRSESPEHTRSAPQPRIRQQPLAAPPARDNVGSKASGVGAGTPLSIANTSSGTASTSPGGSGAGGVSGNVVGVNLDGHAPSGIPASGGHSAGTSSSSNAAGKAGAGGNAGTGGAGHANSVPKPAHAGAPTATPKPLVAPIPLTVVVDSAKEEGRGGVIPLSGLQHDLCPIDEEADVEVPLSESPTMPVRNMFEYPQFSAINHAGYSGRPDASHPSDMDSHDLASSLQWPDIHCSTDVKGGNLAVSPVGPRLLLEPPLGDGNSIPGRDVSQAEGSLWEDSRDGRSGRQGPHAGGELGAMGTGFGGSGGGGSGPSPGSLLAQAHNALAKAGGKHGADTMGDMSISRVYGMLGGKPKEEWEDSGTILIDDSKWGDCALDAFSADDRAAASVYSSHGGGDISLGNCSFDVSHNAADLEANMMMMHRALTPPLIPPSRVADINSPSQHGRQRMSTPSGPPAAAAGTVIT